MNARLPSLPPRLAVLAAMSVLRTLERLHDALMPAQFVLATRMAGFWQTQLLYVAARLRIADRLVDAPKSSEQLARETGANPDALHRVLRALVALGVFETDDDGRFAQNRLSRCLRSDAALSVRELCEYFGSPSNICAWADIERTVMTGDPAFARVHGMSLWEWFAQHPSEGSTFAAAMGRATEQTASTIATSYPWAHHRRICDVGGGRGTLLAEILVRHPHASGVLFDAPSVLADAEAYLRDRGLSRRVELVAGSLFERIPDQCDAYILKDVLHDWDNAKCSAILSNLREAGRHGARLLTCEVLVNQRETDVSAALMDVHMMTVCDAGRQRSAEQLRALLRGAGLRPVRAHPTALPMLSILEAEIPPR